MTNGASLSWREAGQSQGDVRGEPAEHGATTQSVDSDHWRWYEQMTMDIDIDIRFMFLESNPGQNIFEPTTAGAVDTLYLRCCCSWW